VLAVVSAIVAVNVNYVYGAGLGMGWAVPRLVTGIDISVVLAFVNIAALVWFARRLSAVAVSEKAGPEDSKTRSNVS
jgi:hypothetical protein